VRRFAVSVSLCVACYAPRPQPGAPCIDGNCPAGLVCAAATQTCELEDTGVRDAASDEPALIDAVDAPPDIGTDGLACYGAGVVSICPLSPPAAPLDVASSTILDTDTSPLCIAYAGTSPGAFCVIAGTSVSVAAGATFNARGMRPLVVLSTGSIVVDGTVDVASRRAQPPGAGANPVVCAPGTAATGNAGGPGGSFGGSGGAGGAGGVNDGAATPAGPTTAATMLRGGCRGGAGGGATAGMAGNGGGAMYLIGTTITINGTLNASGAGGEPAMGPAGGSGGGSGGMIGLDAPTVLTGAMARVFANGGGGGEGGTDNKDGDQGDDPAMPTSTPNGGSGGANNGGNGGAGSRAAIVGGSNGSNGGNCSAGPNEDVDGGGGGGGGGAGVIRVFPAQTLGGSVAPPQT
jgi:hypothetical protein